MEFVPVLNTALIEVLMLLDAQKIENTFYAHKGAGIPDEELETLGNLVLAWVGEEYFPQLSNVITCTGVKVTNLTTDTSGTHLSPPSGTLAGGVAQPSVPSATAWSVKRLTAARGRSGRGRIFVPAIPETSRVGINGLSPTFATAILNAMADLDDRLTTAGYDPVVVSRVHDHAPRVTGLAQPITSWAYADLVLDTQSRRAPGRGQ